MQTQTFILKSRQQLEKDKAKSRRKDYFDDYYYNPYEC